MYTQAHTRIRFFSSGACHNRLAGHYSDDGACINHNTGSPVKQVSRGCWREHAAMAAAAFAMTNESRYHRGHTKKQTRPEKCAEENNSLRFNKIYSIQLGVRLDILSVNLFLFFFILS